MLSSARFHRSIEKQLIFDGSVVGEPGVTSNLAQGSEDMDVDDLIDDRVGGAPV